MFFKVYDISGFIYLIYSIVNKNFKALEPSAVSTPQPTLSSPYNDYSFRYHIHINVMITAMELNLKLIYLMAIDAACYAHKSVSMS